MFCYVLLCFATFLLTERTRRHNFSARLPPPTPDSSDSPNTPQPPPPNSPAPDSPQPRKYF